MGQGLPLDNEPVLLDLVVRADLLAATDYMVCEYDFRQYSFLDFNQTVSLLSSAFGFIDLLIGRVGFRQASGQTESNPIVLTYFQQMFSQSENLERGSGSKPKVGSIPREPTLG